MFLFTIYAALIILCIITKNKKLPVFLLLSLLFVLLGFSSNNADYENYLLKYQYYYLFKSKTELLFALVVKVCNVSGLTYSQFLIGVSLVFFSVLCFWISRYTDKWPFALALYAIFPFSMDIVQIRNTCALVFVYSGIFFILKKEKLTLKDLGIFSGLLLVGSLFHVMSIVVLFLFLFILFFPKKKVVRYTVIICICILVFPALFIEIMKYISNVFHVSARLMIYLDDFSLHFDHSNLRKCITVIVLNTTLLLLSSYIRKHSSEGILIFKKDSASIVFERAEKLIIALYIFVPLTLIISDTYRIVMEMSIVFYVSFVMRISRKNLFSRGKRDVCISLFLLCFAVFGLYLLVIGSANINSVWYPMFNSNTLIS